MDVAEVRRAVEGLIEHHDDDEGAHSFEDTLRHRVLEAIAAGHPDAQALAAEVLKTSEINFARWCA